MTPSEKLTALAALIEKHRKLIAPRGDTLAGTMALIVESQQYGGDQNTRLHDAIYILAKHAALIEFKTL